MSALNSAASSFTAFILLSSFIFGPQGRAFCRVAVSTLNTLAGYLDWVSLSYISSKYSEILEVLCLLLNEPELQLEAAECLVIAVRRKVSCSLCSFFTDLFSPRTVAGLLDIQLQVGLQMQLIYNGVA